MTEEARMSKTVRSFRDSGPGREDPRSGRPGDAKDSCGVWKF